MSAENKFSIELRVRYKETDQMGVVYYGNYFTWFEVARTEFLRSKGVEYKDLEINERLYLPVVEANCVYRKPVGYDDLVTIEIFPKKLTRAILVFSYIVCKDQEKVAEGFTKHVFIDEKRKPVVIPEKIVEVLS